MLYTCANCDVLVESDIQLKKGVFPSLMAKEPIRTPTLESKLVHRSRLRVNLLLMTPSGKFVVHMEGLSQIRQDLIAIF